MAPKRPPSLPKSLFAPDGPLSHAADQHPAPEAIHPTFITDAHTYGVFLNGKDLPVTGSISIALDNVPLALPGLLLPGSVTTPGKQKTVPAKLFSPTLTLPTSSTLDLILPPSPTPPWDELESLITSIPTSTNVIISGLLPPPLTLPSSPLLQSDSYNTYCGKLGELSLHSGVILKALPPLQVDWSDDDAELVRVLKMYLAPAIETFGTHRIIFGSAPSLPDPKAIPSTKWYTLLRKCLSELGVDSEAMTQIMGSNAVKLYSL